MELILEGKVSGLSFFSGIIILLVLGKDGIESKSEYFHWLLGHSYIFSFVYLLLASIIVFILLPRKLFCVSALGLLLGTTFFSSIVEIILDEFGLRLLAAYVTFLSFFHFSEYFFTALSNPTNLSLTSYLLNHSVAYWVANVCGITEFLLWNYFCPYLKSLWCISLFGALMCIAGEMIRKMAMLTAMQNFNHIVQTDKQNGHRLITHGVYRISRHPSYVGWMWWSVGSQVLLINPVCVAAFCVASWYFFRERIYFEEQALVDFFGEDYRRYQAKVGTGIPLIPGYIPTKYS